MFEVFVDIVLLLTVFAYEAAAHGFEFETVSDMPHGQNNREDQVFFGDLSFCSCLFLLVLGFCFCSFQVHNETLRAFSWYCFLFFVLLAFHIIFNVAAILFVNRFLRDCCLD